MPYDLTRDYGFLLLALTCGDDIDPDEYQLRANSWLHRFHSNTEISDWHWPSVTVHSGLFQYLKYLTLSDFSQFGLTFLHILFYM